MTHCVEIEKVRGCDLVSLLTSPKSKCEGLFIDCQILGKEETQALVRAMESHVEHVHIGDEVTLDIEALAEYSGQGVCKKVVLWCPSLAEAPLSWRPMYHELSRAVEEMRWARSRNWRVEKHDTGILLNRN